MGKQGHNRETQPEGSSLNVEGKCVAFADCFEPLRNNTYSRAAMTSTAGVANIHYGDVLVKYGEVLDFSTADVPSLLPGTPPVGDELRDGDIVIADTAEDETCGRTVEIANLGSRKAVAGLHTIACRPKPGLFVPGWLGYFMNSVSYHRQLVPLMAGIKVLSISRAALKGTTILVPPIAKQRQIVAVFSECNRVVERLQKLLTAKKTRKRALLQQLFEPKSGMRLPKFSGPWTPATLKSIGDFEKGHGITNSQCLSGDCPCIKYGDIYVCYDTHFSQVRSHTTESVFRQSLRVEAGALLFTCSGEEPLDIGKCVVYTGTEPIAVGGDILVFHSHKHDPLFLAYQQQTSPLIRQKASLAKGQSIFHIHLPEIQGLQVFVPPTIEEERAITQTLLAADREIDGLAREIEAWKQKRKALSQLLLSGQVRV